MLRTPIRLAAVCATALLLLGWGLFALDETRAAAELSAQQVAGKEAARNVSPSPEQERLREQAHSDVRELVDDANDILLSPFQTLADNLDDVWAQRSVPLLLGLLLYGFGLGFLARLIGTR